MTTNPDPSALQQLRRQLVDQLDQLPQRDAIDLADANQWIDYVVAHMPHEASWHMARAGGIGGSEIGGLVRNYLGHRADFMFSAHDWAMEKLLKAPPTPTTPAMRRGTEYEQSHRARFYQQFGTNRDAVAYKKLASAKGTRAWMRYSPDDLVVLARQSMETSAGEVTVQGRYLTDYKAPTSVDDAEAVSFQYTAQLHQGAILCAEQNIQINGAILSQFDWANWRLRNDFVPIRPELCDLIRETGDHYWACVLRGEIPAYIRTRRMEIEDGQREAWTPQAARIARLLALSKALGDVAEGERKRLVEGMGLNTRRFGGERLVFSGNLSVTASASVNIEKARELLGEAVLATCTKKASGKPKYDTDKMVAFLTEKGVGLDQFVMPSYDSSKIYQALAEHGHDADAVETEIIKFAADKNLRTQADAWVGSNFAPLASPQESEGEEGDGQSEHEAPAIQRERA
ncbi:YqaJ viral recombinase family protein [Cupriavidus sp. TMH.W2]|uniref:YqaJ viral recombinase family protein n=1 Tax=Cupriavidus sp. TMH.W2 TaxID=3434465 RepID=UPI003D774F70